MHVWIYLTSIVGHVKPSAVRLLYFYSREIIRGLRICNASRFDRKLFKSASMSIAAHVESRIQSAIAFIDGEGLAKLYSAHRFAICGILSFSPSFFGFKPIKSSEGILVDDLFCAISKMSSATYTMLCAIAGQRARSAQVAVARLAAQL